MKILVIRFSSIGDIVLTTPVFRCMHQQLPQAQIHFLTKKSFKAVTEHNPYIHQFHYFDGNLSATIAVLKQENFDVIIDLHKNFRTFKIKKSLKATAYTYKKLSWQKFLLTKLGINVMPKRHITQRCLDTLQPLGVKDDGKGLDYFIAKNEQVGFSDLPIGHAFGYIAIVIGASYATKKLPIPKLQELCTAINHPIILVGGKEDAEEGAAIAAINPDKIYNACGKFSLNESASLVQQSKLVIAH
ncbi:MAG: glycosyltransferase family 9 protein, partial [Chitinophagaceae bacterium]